MQLKTKITLLIVLLILFAAGCQSAAVESPTPTAVEAVLATPTQQIEDEGPRHSVATCQPLETEEDDYTFDSDWIRGADDYSVTLIEYGDYQ